MRTDQIPAFEENEIIQRLPPHLKQFIKPQAYDQYSSINQAVWRYVMRKNISYLKNVAHHSYLNGLKLTGIDEEQIPSMYGMNRILKEIGWAAVAVDGFIPPNAFMEFQAYKVLVIASDIRQLKNIQYTPAPDIIHEAAGHAPIIANPDYAEYLRRLGEIGAKAIMSKHDMEVYEAVRKLSILEEAEGTAAGEITDARDEVLRLQDSETSFSEMAIIRNLQWWSVEYGLIGELENPKIYGAGLLSSIGESEWCLREDVKKLPYSADAALMGFDITKPQPQLFVTPDFSYLMQVLEEVANTMAIRKGGYKGLQKLINSTQVGTIELSTGLQISGAFTEMKTNEDNQVIFFRTAGPTSLAYREKELIGNGIHQHPNGFCSPLGKLKGINLAIEDMGPVDLKAYNFYDGKYLSFDFESGIHVKGLNITGIRNVQGKLILIQLSDCTVTLGKEILFSPGDDVFHLALGKEIIAAFAGAADVYAFPNLYHESDTKTTQQTITEERKALQDLYAAVRQMRADKKIDEALLSSMFEKIKTSYSSDWLLALEMLEITAQVKLADDLRIYLENYVAHNPGRKKLVEDGVQLSSEATYQKL